MARCGAQTPHGPCLKYPVAESVRCFKHGGKNSGRPPVHGRWSALKRAFGSAVDAVLVDPDLRTLDADISLHLIRERELLDRLDEGDSPSFRANALSLLKEAFDAIDEGNNAGMGAALVQLRECLTDGIERDEAWAALIENSAQKAELIQKAVACETRSTNCLTARAALVFMARVLDILQGVAGDDVADAVGQRLRSELAQSLEPDIVLPQGFLPAA